MSGMFFAIISSPPVEPLLIFLGVWVSIPVSMSVPMQWLPIIRSWGISWCFECRVAFLFSFSAMYSSLGLLWIIASLSVSDFIAPDPL